MIVRGREWRKQEKGDDKQMQVIVQQALVFCSVLDSTEGNMLRSALSPTTFISFMLSLIHFSQTPNSYFPVSKEKPETNKLSYILELPSIIFLGIPFIQSQTELLHFVEFEFEKIYYANCYKRGSKIDDTNFNHFLLSITSN